MCVTWSLPPPPAGTGDCGHKGTWYLTVLTFCPVFSNCEPIDPSLTSPHFSPTLNCHGSLCTPRFKLRSQYLRQFYPLPAMLGLFSLPIFSFSWVLRETPDLNSKRTWYLPVVHCAPLTALFMKTHMAFPLLGLELDPGDLAHSLSPSSSRLCFECLTTTLQVPHPPIQTPQQIFKGCS